ncbi:MAG: dienelactone hydrolase family protein [Gammaproteobacteria bacterium]|nr:dienelactone hydrolase family protein [Gammaproteobacteria bacterium]
MVLLFFAFPCAQSSGLQNSTKTFTPVVEMSSKDWEDPVEMERVWQAALVRIPNGEGKYLSSTIEALHRQEITITTTYPTVIYLHGCSGVWKGTYTRINILAKHGYAVIAPVSFARKKYPQSCDPATHQANMYRGTLRMCQYDAGYAIEKAKALSWVDSNNVFLVGLSQGGITTATFSSITENASVNARVIEGWTCNAGWNEYKGIHAPKSEPVLTLVGAIDPWFQNSWTRGDCEDSLNKENDSQSIVYKDGYLSQQHELLESKAVQATVLQFLQSHIK